MTEVQQKIVETIETSKVEEVKAETVITETASGVSAVTTEVETTEKEAVKEETKIESSKGETTAESNKIATVESEEDSDEGVPELEEGGIVAESSKAPSRNEKKARKAITKLGVKAVPGITRVTIRSSNNMVFVVQDADVYKSPTSDCYVVFGEAKVEHPTSRAQATAAEQFRAPETTTSTQEVPKLEEVVDDEEEDDDDEDDENKDVDVQPKDIELVMMQAKCSRKKAIKALRQTNSDVVQACMLLT
jgi:nascent polypeptide-associated complex subunit alpha